LLRWVSLDPTYGANGIKVIEAPFDLTNYSLHKAFPADYGGQYQIHSIDEFSYGYLVIKKVLQNGELDVTYGKSGFFEHGPVAYAGAVRHSDGKITVASKTLNLGNEMYWNAMIVRFNTDGTIDKTTEEGNSYNSGYETIQSPTQQNDKAAVTGMSRSNNLGTSLFPVILNPDGSTWRKGYSFYFNMSDYNIGNDVYMYDQYSLSEFSLRVALDGEKVVAVGSLSVGEQIFVQVDITSHFVNID
jgi:hypothetical protein